MRAKVIQYPVWHLHRISFDPLLGTKCFINVLLDFTIDHVRPLGSPSIRTGTVLQYKSLSLCGPFKRVSVHSLDVRYSEYLYSP